NEESPSHFRRLGDVMNLSWDNGFLSPVSRPSRRWIYHISGSERTKRMLKIAGSLADFRISMHRDFRATVGRFSSISVEFNGVALVRRKPPLSRLFRALSRHFRCFAFRRKSRTDI